MNYHDHICSVRWRLSDARLGELQAADYRCRTCFAADSAEERLEVHHRTYARFGHELIGDLTALCRDCHRVITDALRRRRYQLIHPRIVDTIPFFERPAPLFDPTVGAYYNECRGTDFTSPYRCTPLVDA